MKGGVGIWNILIFIAGAATGAIVFAVSAFTQKEVRDFVKRLNEELDDYEWIDTEY